MNFSVLLSVYFKENAQYLDQALQSLVNQSMLPTEIVVVKDGPLTAPLDQVIDKFSSEFSGLFKIVTLSTNQGLGLALNEGLKCCSNEWVARMDSDDICVPDRFEKQIHYIIQNPAITMLGGIIEEFSNQPGDISREKKVPIDYLQIKAFSKKRNPFNHPTVMFKKSTILSLGGYAHMLYFEDYYLWLKVINSGYIVSNLDTVLLHFRVGNDMIGRRHGLAYANYEINFVRNGIKSNYFTFTEGLIFIVSRLPFRLLPKSVLSAIYKKLIR
jgi:glycosyltransferase involved in cell wall biosynthesis